MALIYGVAEDEEAFDILYCIAFEMMDAQWLAMHASYMNFNVISDPFYYVICISIAKITEKTY